MLPFIDGISSRKQSKEELHHPPARKCQPKNPVAILKRAETRPELRSISVPSMQVIYHHRKIRNFLLDMPFSRYDSRSVGPFYNYLRLNNSLRSLFLGK